MEIGELLYVTTPAEFRRWLRKNHAVKKEIWLVQYKKATGKPTLNLEAATEEALCYGWIDSYVKGMDAERYATRFTPRRPRSNWTETNRKLALRLIEEGRMTKAGKAALPADLQAGTEL